MSATHRHRSLGARLVRLSVFVAVTALIGASAAWPVAAATQARPAAANFGSATVTTETLAGPDQYATSVAVSQAMYPSGSAPVVYLVSGVASEDAIAAGAAAAREAAPILYTAPSVVPAIVANELVRLNPGRVEVIGSSSVIADSVISNVQGFLPHATVVERIAGADGYGTAAALSARTSIANTGATFHAVTPGRVLDSRYGTGATVFHSQLKQSFAVGGKFGVPVDAVAVTGNVTITGQTQLGYVTIAPVLTSGIAPPTSTINFPLSDTRANGITVPLGPGGKLDAMYWAGKTSSTVQVIFDVTGYFSNDTAGATFHAATPGRVLDSRYGTGANVFASQVKQSFTVGGKFGVPVDAVAVTGNVTITGQTQLGYVTIAPSLTNGVPPPTSTINFPLSDTRANGMTVPLGPGGKLDAMYWAGKTSSTAQVIFDVTGYFSSGTNGAMFHAVSPGRVLDSRYGTGANVFASQVKQSFAVGGRFAVPTAAVAVTGNVTITGQTQLGYVTVAPNLTSGTAADTSTINFPLSDTRANGITVPLGSGGKLEAMYWANKTSSTAQVIFDVTGYFVDETSLAENHSSSTVVIASGQDPAEAIIAATLAARKGVPFLLIARDSVPSATAAELARLKPSRALVVGSTTAVPDAAFRRVVGLVPDTERIAGADAYALAAAIATRYFPSSTGVITASASGYAAGLAAVPLAKARTAPILYVGDADLLPVTTRDFLISFRPTHVTFAGTIPTLTQAELVGFSDGRLTKPTDPTTYPAYDSGYHDPGELYTILKAEEIAYPSLVHIFSIGKSYEGRDLWAAKVSSNVSVETDKPETLVDALHHAEEHLGLEQAIYLLETLTHDYATDPFVARIVNERTTWIVFAVNPDGWAKDLAGGIYHLWRKNTQISGGYADTGTDINRNYGYKWACCGGSSSSPWAWNFHGDSAFSSPEARAIRDFVAGRVSGGVQRIKTHITLHANGELILYPYGYTKTALPADMQADDHAAFVAMAQTMAGMNGYTPEQSSQLYITDGDEIDWMYHTYRIFSFTVEVYPLDPPGAKAATAVCPEPQDSDAQAACVAANGLTGTDAHVVTPSIASWQMYPPFSVVAAQTARNRSMLLYAINEAACPYASIGKTAQYCAGAPEIIPAG